MPKPRANRKSLICEILLVNSRLISVECVTNARYKWKLSKEAPTMTDYSVSPAGEKFAIPQADQYAAEFERVESLVEAARSEGKEIVVVMGVGFVGAVMAAIVADTIDRETGKPGKFVIGCQRPSARSYWKIPLLNRGVSPVKAEDPEVEPMIARCVLEKKTLIGTYNSDCLKLADCVVVDVQCDYTKRTSAICAPARRKWLRWKRL